MKSSEQILKELRLLAEKLPTDLQKKVGNVLFGDNEYISKLQGVKIPKGFDSAEINTKWEDDLYEKISKWIKISSNPVASYFAKNKSLLDTLTKEFPQVLQPPIGEMAYRGTSIKIDSLEQAFRKKKFTIVKIKGREVFHFKNLTYTPNRPAQSWTTSPKVAFKFEGIASIRDVKYVQVVYATKVNRDFIFSPELMNIIFEMNENETVRVAGPGTFEAFVDTSVILNTWKLDPEENFIHRLPSAKPYFDMMVDSYNKQVKAENKRMGEELLKFASSVDEIIALGNSETPPGFDINREYTKYAKKYINSVKKNT
jgi:hypothetical protein